MREQNNFEALADTIQNLGLVKAIGNTKNRHWVAVSFDNLKEKQ